MRTFADTEGRTWEIALTIGVLKRVRDLLGLNLLEPEAGDPPLLTRLGTDVILLIDVVFAILKPQADKMEVTDEQFAAALGGEAALGAQTAFYEELVDFFHQLGRTDRARAAETQRRMIDLTIQRIDTKLEHMDLEAEVERALADESPTPALRSATQSRAGGSGSTSSPDTSASTPDP